MRTLIIALVLVLRVSAEACTPAPYPSNALTIVGQQGRPLPNTTIFITDVHGAPIGTFGGAFTDPSGCTPSTQVDPTGVYQFFTTQPGTWYVTVRGEGLTRTYYTTSGLGQGAAASSIDRPAEVLIGEESATLALLCPSRRPCGWQMSNNVDNFVFLDFIMPSYPVTLQNLLISWVPVSRGTARWAVDWTTYANETPPVIPSTVSPIGSANSTFYLTPGNPGERSDTLTTSISVNWQPNDHVVMFIWFLGSDPQTTETAPIVLENVRLEFARQ